MSTSSTSFVPALGFDVLTPLYDAAIALTMREAAFRRRLVEQAAPAGGMRILDLGCGTGTLAIELARRASGAEVVGLDVDPRILALARTKAQRASVDVEWIVGSAVDPPFPAAAFDRVTSTLMLHHLTTDEKERTFRALRRVLRPGGELHVADFSRPHNAYTRIAAWLFQFFDGPERVAANLEGRLPELLRAAGFDAVETTDEWTTLFGTLAFFRAGVRG